ncbi:nitroreductase family protein [Kitasatospora sp. NPDC006697]|uniref:nitroreductase family protein n=1 Tax=Kitasatospora sp. NPDC006697 TaxID=3364020 RepID=UPI0036B82BEF
MTSRPADTSVAIDPLFAERWSPRSFDPAHQLSELEFAQLLEAGRWAPSARNLQPWRFLVGRRGDAAFKLLFDALMPGNQLWAGSASLLFAGVAEESAHPGAAYDLGLAVAQITLQAHALGLHAHQMGGFDAAAVRASFGVPEGFRPVSVVAIGAAAPAELLTDEGLREREGAARERRELGASFFAESWGQPAI